MLVLLLTVFVVRHFAVTRDPQQKDKNLPLSGMEGSNNAELYMEPIYGFITVGGNLDSVECLR